MTSTETGESTVNDLSFWSWLLRPANDQRLAGEVSLARAALGILLLVALYGLAAGFFQGGRQLLVSAFKFPLLLTGTLLLCLPSLLVFAALAGAHFSVRGFLTAVLGFSGRLALLAVAMMPIVWLFSVSTQFLLVAITMHVMIWAFALGLARQSLIFHDELRPVRRVVLLWLLLVWVVGLQVATVCRPVLFTPEGGPLFESGKSFFLEHFDDAAGMKSP